MPFFEAFCYYFIRERDKLLHLGVTSIDVTFNKALVAQYMQGSKNPKKQYFFNNKQNKGPKPSQLAPTPNGYKGTKSKGKKTERNCNFCSEMVI
jgi:hypothetical protein